MPPPVPSITRGGVVDPDAATVGQAEDGRGIESHAEAVESEVGETLGVLVGAEVGVTGQRHDGPVPAGQFGEEGDTAIDGWVSALGSRLEHPEEGMDGRWLVPVVDGHGHLLLIEHRRTDAGRKPGRAGRPSRASAIAQPHRDTDRYRRWCGMETKA